ncbi:hypothetical protein [Aneurinibacillus aneurinilyticus]|uniref:hypothetical protein n=1 Tax=Aneurinibacillus aneurinilyticus TaxID=1391 RepID=UPI0023F49ABE|nr:hypothetical protein [Aneurinibacillus aneurinilyticus]
MKIVRYLTLSLICTFALLVCATDVTWANNAKPPIADNIVELPDAELFKPPVGESTKAMTGVIKVVNYCIAIFGVYLLFHAVFGAFVNAKDLIKGAAWKGLIMEKFKSLGIGLLVVFVGITGAWYEILVFLGGIFQAGVKMFTST